MFGSDNHPKNDDNHIPEDSIDNAMAHDDQNNQQGWGHPGTPLDNNQSNDTAVPSDDTNASQPGTTTAPTAPASTDTLLDLKQQALSSLSPLVDHLDQSPEEKFRTTMMMIQATDDSSKLPDAYEAAKQIQDEKVRAQALLDVINEINYFTSQQQ